MGPTYPGQQQQQQQQQPQTCQYHHHRGQSQLLFSSTTSANDSLQKATSLPNPSTDASATPSSSASISDTTKPISTRLEEAFTTLMCPESDYEKLMAVGLLVGGQVVLGSMAQYMGKFLDLPHEGWGPGYGWTTPAIVQGLAIGFLLRILHKGIEGMDSKHVEDLVMVPRASLLSVFRTNVPVWLALFSAVTMGVSAGIAEEWFFRGVCQTGVYNVLGGGDGGAYYHVFSWLTSILSTSFIFGWLHRVTPVYFVSASLSSVVWGISFGWGDLDHANLVVPVVAHAIYDVLAALETMWQLNSMSEEEHWKVVEWIQRQPQNQILFDEEPMMME